MNSVLTGNVPRYSPATIKLFLVISILLLLGLLHFRLNIRDHINTIRFSPTISKKSVPASVKKCEEVFKYKSTFDCFSKSNAPRNKPPMECVKHYALNGSTEIQLKHYNNEQSESPTNWTKQVLDPFKLDVKKRQFASYSYPPDGVAVFHSMERFSVVNKTVLVIGTIRPWIEATALQLGAKLVVTAEYNKLYSSDPKLITIHPDQLIKWVGKFDYVVSFSSLEHSGLGRYGDPYDPDGDLREMDKIHCVLKPGGIMLLGLPVAKKDKLVFNAHRIYGPVRHKLMIKKFKYLGCYLLGKFSSEPIDLNLSREHHPGEPSQAVFILRK